MRIRNFIIAAILAGIAYIPASTAIGAERQWGSVECWQFLKTPKLLGSGGTLLYPDIFRMSKDGTGINTAGSLGFGAAPTDSGIYWNGTNLILDTTGALGFFISGITEGDLASDGMNIITGDSYQINNASVLNATTLGSAVLASSLTSLGTIASLVATTADINAGTVDGVAVGGSSASSGAFTTLTVSSTATFNGGQTRKQQYYPGEIDLDDSNPPTSVTISGGTGNVWEALQFDADGGSTGDDICYIKWHVPDGYVVDSGRLNVVWSCESAETTGDDVVFDMTVLSVASGEAVDAAMTAFTQSADEQWTGTADLLFTTQLDFEVLTIAVDDTVYITFFVDETASEFTDTIDVHLLEIEWESTE